jgi:hypothetical protein
MWRVRDGLRVSLRYALKSSGLKRSSFTKLVLQEDQYPYPIGDSQILRLA